jgi:type VII secretion-associated protein (TIGR03931 family)
MSRHRAVIEAGPGGFRRLCCGTGELADRAMSAAALSAIDDPTALVDGRPVAVESLWRSLLRSLHCGSSAGVTVVHPSWWSATRVGLVGAAARASADGPGDVVLQPRSWLLGRASPDSASGKVVVEIGERLVAVIGAGIQAVARRSEPRLVAMAVVDVITGMARGTSPVVLIDTPSTITGATALAAAIADVVRDTGRKVVQVDDFRLPGLAWLPEANPSAEPTRTSAQRKAATAPIRFRGRTLAGAGSAAAVVAVLVLVVAPARRHGEISAVQSATTYLVEGRVALTVPANWPSQRVLGGPGSARVQLTSPSDPEVALHVTQSPVVGETLTRAAEQLKEAIDAESSGMFVDFNPAGSSAGRPAVTYREVRAAHQVRWTVLLDGPVRIGVGCQSRPGDEDSVRDVCDRAVRSAHAVG